MLTRHDHCPFLRASTRLLLLLALAALLLPPPLYAARASRLKQTLWALRTLDTPTEPHLHEGPSADDALGARLANDAILRDLGCVDGANGERWCRVALRDDRRLRGWVPFRWLREATAADLQPPAPTPTPVAVPPSTLLTYDAIGDVPCSAPHDEVSERCAFRVVRDAEGATLLLASPASEDDHTLRVIRFEGGEFRSRDGTFTWARHEPDGGWRVSVANREHYWIDGAWLFP